MRPRNGIDLAEQAAALAAQEATIEARKAECAAWRKANPLPFNNIMAVLGGQQASYKKEEERALAASNKRKAYGSNVDDEQTSSGGAAAAKKAAVTSGGSAARDSADAKDQSDSDYDMTPDASLVESLDKVFAEGAEKRRQKKEA